MRFFGSAARRRPRRSSAGREQMDESTQALAFLAGANSIFYGDKLLTTGNPDVEADMAMLRDAGMRALVPATDATEAGTEPLPVASAPAPAPAE